MMPYPEFLSPMLQINRLSYMEMTLQLSRHINIKNVTDCYVQDGMAAELEKFREIN
jgi:hypothetical protein